MGLIKTINSFFTGNTYSEVDAHANSRQNPKANTAKINQYSFRKQMQAILFEPMNYLRVVKVVSYFATSFFWQGAGFITRSQSLKNRSITQKVKAYHEGFDIMSAWAKSKFGDRLLVKAKNIGQLQNNEHREQNANTDLLNRYKTLPEFKKYQAENPDFEKKLRTQITSGVCWASSIEFINKCLIKQNSLGRPLTQKETEEVAKDFAKGIPITATSLFSVYDQVFSAQNFFNRTFIDEIKQTLSNLKHNSSNPRLSGTNFTECIDIVVKILRKESGNKGGIDELSNKIKYISRYGNTKKWCEAYFGKPISNFSKEQKFVGAILEYYLHGKDINKMEYFDKESAAIFDEMISNVEERMLHTLLLNERGLVEVSTRDINKNVEFYQLFKSTEEQLRQFQSLPDGDYQVCFSTADGSHATAYRKIGNVGYLFDPNYGLIQCGNIHNLDVHKLLSLYPPPSDQKGVEKPNYKLQIFGYKLNRRGVPAPFAA